MVKVNCGGKSSAPNSYYTPDLTWSRSCILRIFKYLISLWSILHLGTSTLFTAGFIPLLISTNFICFLQFGLFFIPKFPIKFWDFLILNYINHSNVIVQGITILAPVTSPNTDGINPGKFRFLLTLHDHFLALLSKPYFNEKIK